MSGSVRGVRSTAHSYRNWGEGLGNDPSYPAIEIKDCFGNPVIPREWFLVPLFVVDEVIDKIKDGTIGDYVYDVKIKNAALVARGGHRDRDRG